MTQANIETIWKPIPGTSQEFALDTRCDVTLYTGTRGPGKTDTQLMRFRRHVGVGYGAFWKGIIFDQEYKNLDDLITKSERWFHAFGDGAKFLSSNSALKWVWPSGEELLFRAAEDEKDYWSYHGHEYPYIGFNELTKYPTAAFFDMIQSTNRSSFRPEDYPITIDGDIYNRTGRIVEVDVKHRNARKHLLDPIPLEVFATCNPYGVGHGWVKRRFIDPAPYGKVVTTKTIVMDPRTKQDVEVSKTQVAIFGHITENIYLDPKYVATLHASKNENQKKAWLKGDWDIVAGGAFDDVWDKTVHVLPRFVIPKGWTIDRAFDWGSTHPFSVGWWAEANGEEATIIFQGKAFRFCPPAGTLIQLFEWYGCQVDASGQPMYGENVGLKMSATNIAIGIREREAALLQNEWISGVIWAGPADNQISDVRESDVDTIETKMRNQGITFTASDKSAGSRKIGMDLFRERLEAATSPTKEMPAIYFMDCCRGSIATIPTLPRDPKKLDDVDTKAEDHAYDMVRYRVLKGANRAAGKLNITMPS